MTLVTDRRLGATKGERLRIITGQLEAAAPFETGAAARTELEAIIRDVEDRLSGVVGNVDSVAALTTQTDGRMYPPHDRFEVVSACPKVRTFKQLRHRTSFGENGAIRIETSDGQLVIDLAGADGKTIAVLYLESSHEPG